MIQWRKLWRLNRVTLNPQQDRVMPVSNDFVLVEGEDHTSYRGNFFETPEKAFAHALEDAELSIRRGQQEKERLERARERYEGRRNHE